MKKSIKVAVLGAGNGGQAVAGHLGMEGVDVKLFDLQSFKKNIETISEKGGIELCGDIEGFGKISVATTEISRAIDDVSVVIIVVPSHVQETFVELVAPHINNSQILMLIPGNFGSFVISKVLKKYGKNPIIVETNTLPYACMKIEEGKVDIYRVKSYIDIASLPSTNINEVSKVLNGFFPLQLCSLKNALEVNFMQINMMIHNTTIILNAGRIEYNEGHFRLYWDGATKGVCKVIEMVDKERIEVGKKLNLNGLIPLDDWYRKCYRLKGKDLHELITRNPGYSHWPAPENLSHRYLTEEVPNLLVPVSSFGKLTNTKTPTIDSFIHFASIINETDYFKKGRNLDVLGFTGMSLEEIIDSL